MDILQQKQNLFGANKISSTKIVNNNVPLRTQLIILVASSLIVMTGAIVAPSIPAINKNFSHIANSEFLSKLVLTIPALFIAIGSPFAGLLADRWGRKKLLVMSLVLYGVFGAGCFFLDSLVGILIARAILGIAVAGVMISATTLISDLFEGEIKERFYGKQSAFMAFGAVIFALIGGILADVSWRHPFIVFAGGLVLAPIVWLLIGETKETGDKKFKKARELNIPYLLLAFIYFVTFTGMVLFYMLPVQLPFLFEEKFRASGMVIGLLMAIVNFVSAGFSLLYSKIRSFLNFQAVFAVLFLFMGIGYFILSFAGNYFITIVALIISGMGLGLLYPNFCVWIIARSPEEFRGRAIGGMATFVFLGHFFSPIILRPFVVYFGRAESFRLAALFQALLVLMFVVILISSRWKKSSP